MVEFRKVKKDRTIRLNGVLFEAPVVLIDKKIEARFHIESPDNVEIFFNNISYGFAEKVDPHINVNIGRNWKNHTKTDKKVVVENDLNREIKSIQSGKLFEIKEEHIEENIQEGV